MDFKWKVKQRSFLQHKVITHTFVCLRIFLLCNIDFMQWKEEFESSTSSWFVQLSGKKELLECGKTYYYCNRSGHFHTRGTGQRELKTQGTSKINAYCTATITATRERGSDCIEVQICESHYGHKIALGHLRIPESEKRAVATQLAQGVNFQRILDNIRDNLGRDFKRIHLLTRKDITNIERTYGLQGAQRHKDDATSVCLWVEEMKKSKDNPVIIYKPQGMKQPENCDNLSEKDFVIGIQTPLQESIMKSLTNDRVVCVDGTHGTNGYDFTLITVIVIDEYGEGFPVAWCISNREDQLLLMNFFKALKTRVGNLSPAWFMSDLAEQYYNAWVASFHNRPRKLVCAWHLDRAWRENLKVLEDRNLQAQVYHNLRVLLEEPNKSKFQQLLDETITQLLNSKATERFGKYFSSHYASTKEQWAACYRADASVNTNMYVEAFHRVLKYIYFKGRINKRLDKCLQVLLKLARDKGFERLVKLEKGKNTERINMIRMRHKNSLNLPVSAVHTTDNPDTWAVDSSETGTVYSVTQLNKTCPYKCSTRCNECEICVHMFICSCPDALIKGSICKHIHLVGRVCFNSTTGMGSDPEPTHPEADSSHESYSEGENMEKNTLLATLQDKALLSDASAVRSDVHTCILSLAGYIQTIDDIGILKEVKSRIISTINLIQANQQIPNLFPNTNLQPPTTHVDRQRPFYSTKKKRKISVRIRKPTTTEKKNISKALETHSMLYDTRKEIPSTFQEHTEGKLPRFSKIFI